MFFLASNDLSIQFDNLNISNILISDIFDVFQGIPISLKNPLKNGFEYSIIQPSDISNNSILGIDTELTKIYKSKPVSSKKILKLNDYVITCKGSKIKGLGFLNESFFYNKTVIVNSHIIVLRPLLNNVLSTHDYYYPFIHMLLDMYIEKYNNDLSANKKFITIKELEATLILQSLHFEDLNIFKDLYDKYINALSNFNSSINDLKKFKITLN